MCGWVGGETLLSWAQSRLKLGWVCAADMDAEPEYDDTFADEHILNNKAIGNQARVEWNLMQQRPEQAWLSSLVAWRAS